MDFRAFRLKATRAPVFVVLAAIVMAIGSPGHRADAQTQSLTVSADTQHVTINVAGMYCESCETTVRTMLRRTRGVYSATVNVKRGAATIAYDPRRTTPRALADVINRLGYKATLPRGDKASTAG